MSFWWLQPGWTGARCACGTNIYASGGDPDWGQCYDCFSNSLAEKERERQIERHMEREYEKHLAALEAVHE